MPSYVDNNLMAGEQVLHRARLHKIMFAGPVMLALGVLAFGAALTSQDAGPGGVIMLLAPLFVGPAYITYITSEFAVTTRRVVMKTGFISRQTMETMLTKVENISVDQGLLGRMLDYGDVAVIGSGGTREEFKRIAQPLDLRYAVQSATERDQGAAA